MTEPQFSFEPFVGPRQFESSEENLFFARDAEIAELFNRIVADSWVLLYSRSGLGKSSLIEAGLRPRLLQDGWFILPRARVFGRTPAAPAQIDNPFVWNVLEYWDADGTAGPLAHITFSQYLSRYSSHPRGVLLIFDQFEEFFTQGGSSRHRQEFFQQLRDALVANPILSVLFVIREEFIADLDSYAKQLPGRGLRSRMRLAPLDKDGTRRALESPLQRLGVTIAAPALTALVDQLTWERVLTTSGMIERVPGHFAEPVHLQIVARQLWRALPPGCREITLEHVKVLKDRDPVASFYESCVAEAAKRTGVRTGTILRWCGEVLVTPAGTRAIVYRDANDTAGMPNGVIDILQENHLVRGELRAGAKWFELAHDQFVEPVQVAKSTWERHMAGAIAVAKSWRDRTAEWIASGRESSKALSLAEIVEAQRWLESVDAAEVGADPQVKELIDFSREQNARAQRKTRMLRTQRAAFAAISVAAIAFGIWSFRLLNETRTVAAQKAAAAAQETAAQKEIRDLISREAANALNSARAQQRIIEDADQKVKAENKKLIASQDALDKQIRINTANQLKSKIQDLQRFGSGSDDAAQQLQLKLADLTAKVTYGGNNPISPVAEYAMRLALPVFRFSASSPGGSLAPDRQYYLTLARGVATIYSLEDQQIRPKTIDLRGWFTNDEIPGSARLNVGATRLESAAGNHLIVLDISKQAPHALFNQTIPGLTTFPAFDRAGKRFAVRAEGGVSIWSAETGSQIASVSVPKRPQSIDFSWDGEILWMNNGDTIAFCRAPFDSSVTIPLGSRRASDVAALKNSELLVALDDGGVLRLGSDGKPGDSVGQFPLSGSRTYGPFLDVAPSGSVAMMSYGVFQGNPSQQTSRLVYESRLLSLGNAPAMAAEPVELSFYPQLLNDSRLIARNFDGSISIRTLDARLESIIDVASIRSNLSFSSGDIARVNGDGSVTLLRADHGASAASITRWHSVKAQLPAGPISGILLQRSGAPALVAYQTGEVMQGDPFSGKVEPAFKADSGLSEIAADRSTLAAVELNGDIGLWNISAKHRFGVIQTEGAHTTGLAFSNDGSRLATVNSDGVVMVWAVSDAASDRPGKSLPHPPAAATSIAFWGTKLITGAADGSVSIWDTEMRSPVELVAASHPAAAVLSLAVDNDQNLLAAGAEDKTVRIYALRPGPQFGHIALTIDLYDSAVQQVSFDDSGRNIAAITQSGVLRMDPISPLQLMQTIAASIEHPFDPETCLTYAPLVPRVCPGKQKASAKETTAKLLQRHDLKH